MLQATLSEFEKQFGTRSARRSELYSRFSEWLTVAQATGALQKVWVFGSYATQKLEPGDLDLFALFAEGFHSGSLASAERSWFDHELCHEIHELDLFFVTESIGPQALELMLETFSRDRQGQPALVEVVL